MTLNRIGYWRGASDATAPLPDPHDLIDDQWDPDERDAAWFYFANGTLFRTFMGHSPCRICGQDNGAVEYTDGTYVWPEGLAHYIEAHNVRLPDALIRHAVARLNTMETVDPTTDWWADLARG